MKNASSEEILQALKRRIERAKKTLEGLDPNGDQDRYRSARKRLKRAQRRLRTWQQLSEALEKKRQASAKRAAGKPAARKDEKKAEAAAEEKPEEADAAEEKTADAAEETPSETAST
jgi:hypothetical protein